MSSKTKYGYIIVKIVNESSWIDLLAIGTCSQQFQLYKSKCDAQVLAPGFGRLTC
jgi:hypothetical protein